MSVDAFLRSSFAVDSFAVRQLDGFVFALLNEVFESFAESRTHIVGSVLKDIGRYVRMEQLCASRSSSKAMIVADEPVFTSHSVDDVLVIVRPVGKVVDHGVS
jgi:hypothetical protein